MSSAKRAPASHTVFHPPHPPPETNIMEPQHQQHPPPEDAELAARSLWIGDLPPHAGEAWLASLFGGADGVEEAKVVRSRATGGCQGYGFLCFASPAHAAAALQQYAGMPIPGGWGGVFRLNWASGGNGHNQREGV